MPRRPMRNFKMCFRMRDSGKHLEMQNTLRNAKKISKLSAFIWRGVCIPEWVEAPWMGFAFRMNVGEKPGRLGIRPPALECRAR